METHELEFPISRPHAGIYMGNGNMGVMVWGRDHLCLTVNRADLWDRRNGVCLDDGSDYRHICEAYDPLDTGPINERILSRPNKTGGVLSKRLPVGRFEVELADGWQWSRASLDYQTGEVAVVAESRGVSRSSAVVLALGTGENVLLIADPSGVIARVRAIPAWDVMAQSETEVVTALFGSTPVETWFRDQGFGEPERVSEDGLVGWFQACPADPGIAAAASRLDAGWGISLELGADRAGAMAHARESLGKLEARGAEDFRNTSRGWWNDYWRERPEIDLGDAEYNRRCRHVMYQFGAATNPWSTHPACLVGPWVEDHQPAPWRGDYHMNCNIQMIYSPAFSAGAFEHLRPLFDMLDSEPFQNVMRRNARAMFGIDDGLLMTHAVDDRGFQSEGLLSAGSVLDFASGGWTAQLYWLTYQYTLDVDFLRERAYPFLYGAMRVYEEALEDRDGRFSLPVNTSAEYRFHFKDADGRMRRCNAGRDPSYQLSCVHMLLDALFESCRILGIGPRPAWRRIKEKLPPFTTIANRQPSMHTDGFDDVRIAIWEDQDLDESHRHHSHLACIHPFDSLGDARSPEIEAILDATIQHWILKGTGDWCPFSFPWAAILLTRLGFADAAKLMMDMWKEMFINEGGNSVYFPIFPGFSSRYFDVSRKPEARREVFQPDSAMLALTALCEMCAHARGGTVHVFAGISRKWPNVSFRRIRLPGAFEMSGTRRNGRTQRIEITSLRGGTLKLAVADREEMVLVRGSGRETIALPGAIEMSVGEQIVLEASDSRP